MGLIGMAMAHSRATGILPVQKTLPLPFFPAQPGLAVSLDLNKYGSRTAPTTVLVKSLPHWTVVSARTRRSHVKSFSASERF